MGHTCVCACSWGWNCCVSPGLTSWPLMLTLLAESRISQGLSTLPLFPRFCTFREPSFDLKWWLYPLEMPQTRGSDLGTTLFTISLMEDTIPSPLRCTARSFPDTHSMDCPCAPGGSHWSPEVSRVDKDPKQVREHCSRETQSAGSYLDKGLE